MTALLDLTGKRGLVLGIANEHSIAYVHAGWRMETPMGDQKLTSNFSGFNGSFSVEGRDDVQHSFVPGISVAWKNSKNLSLMANYSAQFSDDLDGHAVILGFSYKW